MKKVLVVAGLGLIALSFGCGGGDDNSGIDATTSEGKGKSDIIYSEVCSKLDFSHLPTPGTNSVGVNTDIEPTDYPCNVGKVVTSGSYSEGNTGGTATVISDFQECSATDDVCMTEEEVIMNGIVTTDVTVEVSSDGTDATISMGTNGTIKLTGMFTASCVIKLTLPATNISEINSPENITTFTGSVCGVDIKDILDITETERDTLCAAIAAAPAVASL